MHQGSCRECRDIAHIGCDAHCSHTIRPMYPKNLVSPWQQAKSNQRNGCFFANEAPILHLCTLLCSLSECTHDHIIHLSRDPISTKLSSPPSAGSGLSSPLQLKHSNSPNMAVCDSAAFLPCSLASLSIGESALPTKLQERGEKNCFTP